MKICPKCQQTYTDETLNFCLNDGTTLAQTGAGSADDLPQTVMIQPPRQTNPGQSSFGNQSGQNQGFGSQAPQFGAPSQQGGWNASPQQPQFSMQTPSASGGSKTWIWVLGILGVLVLVCGGGFGLLVLIGMNSDNYANNTTYNSATPTPNTKNLTKYDMSRWTSETDEYATTKYSGGNYSIETIRADYYYVVLTKDLQTQDKITKLTVKTFDAKSVSGGFGLVVHSYATPLVGDYAFLIDTDKKRYRIVEHLVKTEKVLVAWKDSSAIKGGSSENILEVRDNGDKMEFYINGQRVDSIDDKYANSTGVAGLYACDGIKIEYSNLTTETK